MTKKIRWGIISTAKIGLNLVIPAIQNAHNSEVVAISSRNLVKAQSAAKKLGIEKSFGSYESMLNDPDIDVIYNPLPNHMHLSWTLKALEAGKHVLCEKPVGMNAREAKLMMEASKKQPHLKLMEAFMYRFHPQWVKVKSLVDSGAIGEVKSVHSIFTYNNPDPTNIRNIFEVGGGALMDIGCYVISFPRFIFGKEPNRVVGIMQRDPVFKTDCLSSGMLDFDDGKFASFTCSTQLDRFQRVQILGPDGRIEIEIPVNTPSDESTRIWITSKGKTEEISFPAVDQYQLEIEAFSKAIANNEAVPTSFEDAVNNMKVIDGIVESAKNDPWYSL